MTAHLVSYTCGSFCENCWVLLPDAQRQSGERAVRQNEQNRVLIRSNVPGTGRATHHLKGVFSSGGVEGADYPKWCIRDRAD